MEVECACYNLRTEFLNTIEMNLFQGVKGKDK
jgi:hypothetical protein